MDCRIFGKELTNLMEVQGRNRKSYSYIHGQKHKDLSYNLYKPLAKPNRSTLFRQDKQDSPKLQSTNPQMVPQYFHENMRFMRRQERESFKGSNYISQHKTVSEAERAKLIDWIAKLNLKYKMFPETLFSVVYIVDQYLRTKEVMLAELQLVGVAALFIAAKFQETYQVPPLKQLITCCANQYTSTQILEKEADIIRQLNFSLIINSIYKFFEPMVKVIGLDAKNEHLAHYVLELSLLQPRFLVYSPSLLAASAIYLIKKIRKTETPWSTTMTSFVAYEQKQLKMCAKQLCTLLQCAPDLQNARAIKEKFSQGSFHEVTRIKLQRKEKK